MRAAALGIRVDDERDAREAGRAGVTDRQRLDVVAAPPDERRHAVEHAGFVGD